VLGRLSYPVYVLQYPAGIVILTLPKLLSGPGVQLAGWATIAIFLLGCALVDRFYDGPLRDWMTRRAIAHRLLPLSRDQKADATTRPL
jgi:peptidoglycan/LPS O-acetylase OafA/YrhL